MGTKPSHLSLQSQAAKPYPYKGRCEFCDSPYDKDISKEDGTKKSDAYCSPHCERLDLYVQ